MLLEQLNHYGINHIESCNAYDACVHPSGRVLNTYHMKSEKEFLNQARFLGVAIVASGIMVIENPPHS